MRAHAGAVIPDTASYSTIYRSHQMITPSLEAEQPERELRSTLDLFGHGLQLLDIPMSPHKLPIQKPRPRTRSPDRESRRQLD